MSPINSGRVEAPSDGASTTIHLISPYCPALALSWTEFPEGFSCRHSNQGGQSAACAVSESGWTSAGQAGHADLPGEITHSASSRLQIVQSASLPPITAMYIKRTYNKVCYNVIRHIWQFCKIVQIPLPVFTSPRKHSFQLTHIFNMLHLKCPRVFFGV